MEPTISRVGVIDKSLWILDSLREGPKSLDQLVNGTGLARPTVHRLAVALEVHGMLRRTANGRFALGLGLISLGRMASEQFPITEAATGPLAQLREHTGESVQLYVRDGDTRVCIASLESPHGLRTIVNVGQVLPLDRGSAGRVLNAEVAHSKDWGARWIESAGEREPGVASVSAAVVDQDRRIAAAVSVSGPVDRMGETPGDRYGEAVVAAARQIESALA